MGVYNQSKSKAGADPDRFPPFHGNRQTSCPSEPKYPEIMVLRESLSKTFPEGACPWTDRPHSRPRTCDPSGLIASGRIQHRKYAIHGLVVKSNWLKIQNEYSAHAQKLVPARVLYTWRSPIGSGLWGRECWSPLQGQAFGARAIGNSWTRAWFGFPTNRKQTAVDDVSHKQTAGWLCSVLTWIIYPKVIHDRRFNSIRIQSIPLYFGFKISGVADKPRSFYLGFAHLCVKYRLAHVDVVLVSM